MCKLMFSDVFKCCITRLLPGMIRHRQEGGYVRSCCCHSRRPPASTLHIFLSALSMILLLTLFELSRVLYYLLRFSTVACMHAQHHMTWYVCIIPVASTLMVSFLSSTAFTVRHCIQTCKQLVTAASTTRMPDMATSLTTSSMLLQP